MIIVADASPLIFLGKIRELALIRRLFPGEVLVPTTVRDELLAPPASPAEARVLSKFLSGCEVVRVRKPRFFSAAMSRADHEALSLAIRRHADILLADERMLRDMARAENIRPLGTLGILLRATEARILSAAVARQKLDELVSEHRLRIGIEVYGAVLSRIKAVGRK